jgi:hypothetical protein
MTSAPNKKIPNTAVIYCHILTLEKVGAALIYPDI